MLCRAARWLGVAPWDLAERPNYWREWALAFETAENWAKVELMERR